MHGSRLSSSAATIHDSKFMETTSIQDIHARPTLAQPEFIGHRFAVNKWDSIQAALFEYTLAGNGLLIRAKRDEFTVSIPFCSRSIRGLPESYVGIMWHRPRIRHTLWEEILRDARHKYSSSKFKEDVYLIYWDKYQECWRWRSAGRESNWSATIADDTLPEYSKACIELHTHPPGALNFSAADDRDESGKFRIFGILVDVHDKPKIRFRCGVYDHLMQIPSSWIGLLPRGIVDLNEIDALLQMML